MASAGERLAAAIALGLSAAVGSIPASADRDWTAGLEGEITSDGESMVYRYYLPSDYDPAQSYPLVLSLHGAGSVGNDNVRNVQWVIDDLIMATESDYPAILLAPQIARSGWGPFNSADLTVELLEAFLADFPIDRRRLYVTGASMGDSGR